MRESRESEGVTANAGDSCKRKAGEGAGESSHHGTSRAACSIMLQAFASLVLAQLALGNPCPAVPVDSVAPPRVAQDSVVGETGPRPAPERASIVLLVSATARTVRHATVPSLRVRLCGGLDSVRVVERVNLPERVVAGATYRDVRVALALYGTLDGACLAERLGVASARADTASGRAACAGVRVTVPAGARGTEGAPVRPPPSRPPDP